MHEPESRSKTRSPSENFSTADPAAGKSFEIARGERFADQVAPQFEFVASKDEVAAAEAAPGAGMPLLRPSRCRPRDSHGHVTVFDVAFGHPINLSQWGGLDYEIAFYSYRFAGEDHIQPALIDKVGTRTVVSRNLSHYVSEDETFTR